jgi:hypothetical protein
VVGRADLHLLDRRFEHFGSARVIVLDLRVRSNHACMRVVTLMNERAMLTVSFRLASLLSTSAPSFSARITCYIRLKYAWTVPHCRQASNAHLHESVAYHLRPHRLFLDLDTTKPRSVSRVYN